MARDEASKVKARYQKHLERTNQVAPEEPVDESSGPNQGAEVELQEAPNVKRTAEEVMEEGENGGKVTTQNSEEESRKVPRVEASSSSSSKRQAEDSGAHQSAKRPAPGWEKQSGRWTRKRLPEDNATQFKDLEDTGEHVDADVHIRVPDEPATGEAEMVDATEGGPDADVGSLSACLLYTSDAADE